MTENDVLKVHRRAHREYLAGNAPKTKAGASAKKCTAAERPNQGLKQTDLVAFNQGAEKVAVQYLTAHIQQEGAPTFNTACNLIALELDVSVETAKRYLRKYSVNHPKAAFSIENGYVTLRGTNGKSR